MNPHRHIPKPSQSSQVSRGTTAMNIPSYCHTPANGKFIIHKSRPVNNHEEKGGSNSYTLPRPICDLTHLELFPAVQGDTWKSLKVIFLCSNLQAAKRILHSIAESIVIVGIIGLMSRPISCKWN